MKDLRYLARISSSMSQALDLLRAVLWKFNKMRTTLQGSVLTVEAKAAVTAAVLIQGAQRIFRTATKQQLLLRLQLYNSVFAKLQLY